MKVNMEIVGGECVLCTETSVVLSESDNQDFFEIIKDVFFRKNESSFSKFTEAKGSKSVCIVCASKLDSIRNIIKDYKPSSAKKKKLNSCSLCLKSNRKYVFPVPSYFSTLGARFLSIVKQNAQVTDICIHCCFALFSWDKFRSALNYEVSAVEDSESATDVNEDAKAEMASKRTKTLPKRKSVSTSEDENKTFRKRSKRDNLVNENVGRTVRTRSNTHLSAATNNKKARRLLPGPKNKPKPNRVSKVQALDVSKEGHLTRILSHLKTVNMETVSRNMHLSYDVLIDKTMMFAIPYVALKKRNLHSNIHELDQDVIVLSSDDCADEETVENGTILRRGLRKRVAQRSSGPPKKVLRNNRTANKIHETTYRCSTCNDDFLSNANYKLHTLEHEVSFSPLVVLEKCNLSDKQAKMVADMKQPHRLEATVDTDSDTFHTGSSNHGTDDEISELVNANEIQAEDKELQSEEASEEPVDEAPKDREARTDDESQAELADDTQKQSEELDQEKNVTTEISKTYTEEDIDKVINKYVNIDMEGIEEKEVVAEQNESQANNTLKTPKYKPGPKSRLARRKMKLQKAETENHDKKQSPDESLEGTELDKSMECDEAETKTDTNEPEPASSNLNKFGESDDTDEKLDEQPAQSEKVEEDSKADATNENVVEEVEEKEKKNNETTEEGLAQSEDAAEPAEESVANEKPESQVNESTEEENTAETLTCNGERGKLDDSLEKATVEESVVLETEETSTDVVEKSEIENKEELNSDFAAEDSLGSDSEAKKPDETKETITEEKEQKDAEEDNEALVEKSADAEPITVDGSSSSCDVVEVATAKTVSDDANLVKDGLQDSDGDEEIRVLNLDNLEDLNKEETPLPNGEEIVVTTEECPKGDSDIESLTVSSQGSDESDKAKREKYSKTEEILETEIVGNDVTIECTSERIDNFKEVENLLENLGA